MNIVFIHYHLKPGGVTTVLKDQVAAFRKHCFCCLISGETEGNDFEVPVYTASSLAYKDSYEGREVSLKAAEEILGIVRDHTDGEEVLFFFHNTTLGKNPHMTEIVSFFINHGFPVVQQLHDFAEDGRPALLDPLRKYPSGGIYTFINSRDREIFKKAGLPVQASFLLENRVRPFKPAVPSDGGISKNHNSHKSKLSHSENSEKGYYLYPVRAIRRKNIGEILLLSRFLPEKNEIKITLPPNSPADIPSYEHWKAVAAHGGYPVEFEAGNRYEFKKLVQNARAVMTVSINEGFGFTFLEPWTAAKFLLGRRLDFVVSDFEQNGMDFSHLYTKIEIPVSWFDYRSFSAKRNALFEKYSRLFKIPQDVRKSYFKEFEDEKTRGFVDFGLLNERFQKEVLGRISNDKQALWELADMNPFLKDLFHPGGSSFSTLIDKNRLAVLNRYNMNVYREKLNALAELAVSRKGLTFDVCEETIRKEFLKPKSFSLLKWGESGL